jgi:hypothetical protein
MLPPPVSCGAGWQPNATRFSQYRPFCISCGAGNLARSRFSGGFRGMRGVLRDDKRRLKAGGWSFYIFHQFHFDSIYRVN